MSPANWLGFPDFRQSVTYCTNSSLALCNKLQDVYQVTSYTYLTLCVCVFLMVGQTARLIRTKLGTRPHLVLVQSSSRSAKTAVKTGMNAIGMRMEAPQWRVERYRHENGGTTSKSGQCWGKCHTCERRQFSASRGWRLLLVLKQLQHTTENAGNYSVFETFFFNKQ